jgi:hypothetical protein
MNEALARGGLKVCLAMGHTWPVVPSMMNEVLITGPQNDRCYRCGMRRVIHEDGSRTYSYNPVLTNQQTTDKEVVMNDQAIPTEVRVALPELCDSIIEVMELIKRQPIDDYLAEVIDELELAIDHINEADVNVNAHNAKVRADAYEATNPRSDYWDDGGGNWDAVNWVTARDGDRIVLRDPDGRENGGPVYVIDGVPAWRADGTLSVVAQLISVAGNRWNWPNGPSLMEFAESVWQVWRDFEVQS